MTDAVVIGAGPNGLVAANILADHGWSVDVVERAEHPGGAVRSDRGVHPDYVHDLFSSFYPLAAASPVMSALDLTAHGLVWSRADAVLAHPRPDGSCALLHQGTGVAGPGRDFGTTGPDLVAWDGLARWWRRQDPWLIGALFAPFPPVRAAAALSTGFWGPAFVVRLLPGARPSADSPPSRSTASAAFNRAPASPGTWLPARRGGRAGARRRLPLTVGRRRLGR